MDYFTLVTDPAAIVSGIATIIGIIGGIFTLRSVKDVPATPKDQETAESTSEKYSDDDPLGLVAAGELEVKKPKPSGYKARAAAKQAAAQGETTPEKISAVEESKIEIKPVTDTSATVTLTETSEVIATPEAAAEKSAAVAETVTEESAEAVLSGAESTPDEQPAASTVAASAEAKTQAKTEAESEAEVEGKLEAETEADTEAETAAESEAETETAAETAQSDLEPAAGRMERLRSRLGRSGSFGKALLGILASGDLSIDDWEDMEDQLLMADLGIDAAAELIDHLRTEVKVRNTSDPAQMRQVLRDKLLELVETDKSRDLDLTKFVDENGEEHPASILVVGVNGVGKTTFIGKLARLLKAEDKDVILGAADTFRAAAAEQLCTWGERTGVPVVRSERENADPASVAFDTIAKANAENVDVAIVDTAGRLQNKSNLMDELGKVKRVMSRQAPVNEVLLVLDATTGQNGMQQARVFAEVAQITGIVLTKLDGSAKGGVVVSVQRELGVPVKFVGLGEGPDDLAPFDPEVFVDTIVED